MAAATSAEAIACSRDGIAWIVHAIVKRFGTMM